MVDGGVVVLRVMLGLVGCSVGDPLCAELGWMSFKSWESGAETKEGKLGTITASRMWRSKEKPGKASFRYLGSWTRSFAR